MKVAEKDEPKSSFDYSILGKKKYSNLGKNIKQINKYKEQAFF